MLVIAVGGIDCEPATKVGWWFNILRQSSKHFAITYDHSQGTTVRSVNLYTVAVDGEAGRGLIEVLSLECTS